MKIYGQLQNCLVMTKKEQPGKKDPSKKYCYLGVVMDNELGEISVTEDVYNSVELWHTYDFGFCYNTNFEMFQLERSVPLGMVNIPVPSTQPAEADKKAGKS